MIYLRPPSSGANKGGRGGKGRKGRGDKSERWDRTGGESESKQPLLPLLPPPPPFLFLRSFHLPSAVSQAGPLFSERLYCSQAEQNGRSDKSDNAPIYTACIVFVVMLAGLVRWEDSLQYIPPFPGLSVPAGPCMPMPGCPTDHAPKRGMGRAFESLEGPCLHECSLS